MKFYVYVDYTQESIPRPFYVGKGKGNRFDVIRRNCLHTKIVNEFGVNRIKVFETDSEVEAFQKEIELIREYKTYIHDNDYCFGANQTTGGDGVADINNRRVYQYDKNDNLIKEYKNFQEVAGVFNLNPATLSNVFSDRNVMPIAMREFKWITQSSHRKQTKTQHKNAIKILELDPLTQQVIAEHDSISIVCSLYNIRYIVLSMALRGNEKAKNTILTKCEKIFQFKDENCMITRQKNATKKATFIRAKPITLTNKITGTVQHFSSMSSAAMFLRITVDHLMKVLYENLQLQDYDCLFVNEQDKIKLKVHNRDEAYKQKISIKNGKAIIQLNVDHTVVLQEFSSYSRAEKILQIKRGLLWDSLKTKNMQYFVWNDTHLMLKSSYVCAPSSSM